ncbi:cysteine proteinase [Xylariaceae sp. FL0255]|nr:cysteine proteinase [Xylariaceae sp. FL0255]
MMSTTAGPDPADPPVSDNVLSMNGVRRSGRPKKPSTKLDDEYTIPAAKPSRPSAATGQSRPKRKAAEAAIEHGAAEEVDVLQEHIFARMDIDERKEYRGWVELESEPGFFNAMLQDLDAKAFKVQEMFLLDEIALDTLPKPVFGLLFLYQWSGEDEASEVRQECPENLWFGNQTTANACATVALMNIIMNAHGVELGSELQQFRDSTKVLPPPHRGHALDSNDFIRAIHNSVARRNDLVSEDLLLDNKFEAASKRRKSSGTTSRSKKKAARCRKKDNDDGTPFHYIAFVPEGGQVWELDGLEARPLRLGPYDTKPPDSWLKLAMEAIQTRMSRRDDEFLAFNLLAVCQSPISALTDELAVNLASADALCKKIDSVNVPKFSADRLKRFRLTHEKVVDYLPPSSFMERISASDFDAKTGQEMADELRAEQDRLEAEYVIEMTTIDEAVGMIRGRQRDYTPAVHQWLRILAEKGALRELIQAFDG